MASLVCCKVVEIGVDRMFPMPRVSRRKLNMVVARDGSSSACTIHSSGHMQRRRTEMRDDALATGRTNPFHMLDQQPAVLPYATPNTRMPASEYESTPQRTNVASDVSSSDEIASAQTLYRSLSQPIANPAKIEAAFTSVSASDAWLGVSPSADANAGTGMSAVVRAGCWRRTHWAAMSEARNARSPGAC